MDRPSHSVLHHTGESNNIFDCIQQQYTHTHNTQACAHMHTHTHIQTCRCKHSHTYLHSHTYTQTYTHTDVRTQYYYACTKTYLPSAVCTRLQRQTRGRKAKLRNSIYTLSLQCHTTCTYVMCAGCIQIQ